jgi:pSer/pThr/pTyr-binding forkhead associated (FHA) protein
LGAYFDWWDGRERRALVLDGERLTVGSAADNDVVVEDASVSRIHAMLHQLNGRWFIEDCGSRNGSAVNGRQLTSMHPLRSDDEVRLGRARLVFCGQVSPSGNPTEAVVERPTITAREHDVLVALCRPLANGDIFTEPASVREMAAELSVSENAIKLHLANLATKFGIDGADRRRSRLANAALDAGVVTLADLRARHD